MLCLNFLLEHHLQEDNQEGAYLISSLLRKRNQIFINKINIMIF